MGAIDETLPFTMIECTEVRVLLECKEKSMLILRVENFVFG
jgi:hypothetical protein